MTIASFCHDLLLTEGPLPLPTLARRAADAGVTRARDPEAAVRSAIADAEVQLADGRWTTPLLLLEGRVITARRLPLRGAPWTDEHVEGVEYDVAPLERALRCGPVALSGGGELRRRGGYRSAWIAPRGWPDLEVEGDELIGLRIRGGTLHLERVPITAALQVEGERVAEALDTPDSRGRWSAWRSDDIAADLWSRLATDPALLARPAPPLSRCVPAFAQALDARREQRRRLASSWTVTLELPARLQDVALSEARRSGELLLDWLQSFVADELRELEKGLEAEWPDEEWEDEQECGQLLRLPGLR